MRQPRHWTIPAAWSLLLAAEAAAQAEDRSHVVGDLGKELAATIARAETVGFRGAVLAARNGKVVVAAGCGHADLDDRVPNTPATLFEIASASKQFTAAAALRLVDLKRLRLDDPMARHLPGIPDDCAGITVRHLLTNTSGIPGTNSEGWGDDLAAVLPTFLQGGPRHPPGSHWEYWNQGWALASEVIARASGESFVRFSHEQVFRRAGLRTTMFTGDTAPAGATVAVGRSQRGNRTALEHPYGAFGFQYRGMGGVVTTVWDLWRWDRALAGNRLLGKAARAELFRPGLGDYALGWWVRKNARGRLVQFHGGGVRGFAAMLRRFPDQDGLLCVLANDDEAPIHQLADRLEALLFGDPAPGPDLPEPVDAKLAAALVGTYDSEGGRRLTIRQAGRALRVEILWSPGNADGPVTRAVLGADQPDGVLLYEWSASTPLQVSRDAAGGVDTVTLGSDRYRRQ